MSAQFFRPILFLFLVFVVGRLVLPARKAFYGMGRFRNRLKNNSNVETKQNLFQMIIQIKLVRV